MKKSTKLVLPLSCLSILALSALATGLTAQSPLSIAQSTNKNLNDLVASIPILDELPQKEEVVVISHAYEDVPKHSWYETAIDYVVSHQIMSPLSATTFAPDKDITRGILSTVFTNALGAELGETETLYPDVSNQWYHDAVHWCAEMELMTGYPNGKFGGNDPMIREQLAVTLYRYAQFAGLDPENPGTTILNRYPDGKEVSSFAQIATSWCLQENIFHDQDEIRPKDNSTRGEIAYAMETLGQMLSNHQP